MVHPDYIYAQLYKNDVKIYLGHILSNIKNLIFSLTDIQVNHNFNCGDLRLSDLAYFEAYYLYTLLLGYTKNYRYVQHNIPKNKK